jgi:hypothetical protein
VTKQTTVLINPLLALWRNRPHKIIEFVLFIEIESVAPQSTNTSPVCWLASLPSGSTAVFLSGVDPLAPAPRFWAAVCSCSEVAIKRP